MKNASRQFLLGFGTLAILLAVSTSAHAANSVRFALTATVQGPTVEKPAGVFTQKVTPLQITNKGILKLLGIVYPAALTPGAVLSILNSGQFVINDKHGSVLQLVDPSILKTETSAPPVSKGVDDQNLGNNHFQHRMLKTLILAASGGNTFSLACDTVYKKDEKAMAYILTTTTITAIGTGKLDAQDSYLEGKVILHSEAF